MGIVDNIRKRMTGADSYEDTYEDDGYYADSFGSYEATEETEMNAGVAPAAGVGMGTGMSMGSGISISGNSGSALEMKVVKPDSFDSVAQIADHLLNHRTVVLNLESTNREIAKRLIDFLAGVAYSINGQLRNVANNTYIITPCNVDVADSPMKLAEPKNVMPDEQAAPTVNLTSDTLF